jgi:hypothetical protein
MNIENMKRLVAKLESIPERKFRMEQYFGITEKDKISFFPKAYEELRKDRVFDPMTDCRTTACIAGWAIACMSDEELKRIKEAYVTVDGIAMLWLGLTNYEIKHLFMGEWCSDYRLDSVGTATLPEAIDYLKSVIKKYEAGERKVW